MRTSKGNLLRTCCNKGVSHYCLPWQKLKNSQGSGKPRSGEGEALGEAQRRLLAWGAGGGQETGEGAYLELEYELKMGTKIGEAISYFSNAGHVGLVSASGGQSCVSVYGLSVAHSCIQSFCSCM